MEAPVAAALQHPIYEPYQPWLRRLPTPPQASADALDALAREAGIRVESGAPLRFVAPSGARGSYGDYEMRVYETGQVQTRPGNWHDFFNALAWLAFPRAKAELNRRHALEIPSEQGRRGRFRDLLTLLDEGGVLVACDDASLLRLLAAHEWKALFWERRAEVFQRMRLHVLGHAVLEQALHPRPGITCKALLLRAAPDPDGQAARWLREVPREATPRELPVLPVFGFPGWMPGNERPRFYDDQHHFRPLLRPDARMAAGVGRAAAAHAEESPGSTERDAG